MDHGRGVGVVLGRSWPSRRPEGARLKRAADAWRRGKLTPTVKKVFAAWFRVFG